MVWDNQQVTKSWFTGILEGEGCFQNTKKKSIEVCITNTDLDIIEACEAFLISYHIWFTRTEQLRIKKKPCYTLLIRNSSRQVFQYASMLFEIISPVMDCRLNEYRQLFGSSEIIRDPSVDLNWMAGIYEAEGSFSLILNNRNIAALNIELSNTNERIIEKVILNLKAIGCSWHTRSIACSSEHHKQATAINIYGMRRCQRFLNVMENKWMSERNVKRTSLMSEFIRSRFDHAQKDPYTPREIQIIQAMRDLNRR